MMRKLWKNVPACVLLVVAFAATAGAQQSAFQDAKGESSVFIKDGGGFTRVNVGDKSIDFGYMRDRGDERVYFGFDAKGKSSGNFASLFNGGTPSPEAELGFTLGKRFLTVKSDNAILEECIQRTAGELKGNMAKLIAGAEEEFIAGFKKKRVPELQKQLTDAIKEALVKEAMSKGISETGARGVAATFAPKAIEEEATRMAEAEARAELAGADRELSRGLVEGKAIGDAAKLCADEDTAFHRRRTLDWLSFRVAYNRARYKILDETASFANQARKQNFDGYSATLAYNTLLTLDDVKALKARRKARRDARLNNQPPPKESALGESKGSVILGVSIGVKRTNNAGDLDSVEVEDQSFTSMSGTTQRRVVSKQTLLSGDYKQYIAVPLNSDVVVYPGAFRSRLAIDFFTRSNLAKTNREFVPGVGLFITKEGKPTKVVGGISFALDDGKGRVGLVGGFHF